MITLRILTRKSKLGVGALANDTVGRLLELKKYQALRHIYYCYEGITFQDDILDEINITHRIKKPGSEPNYERLNKFLMEDKRKAYLRHRFEERGDDPELARYKSMAIIRKQHRLNKKLPERELEKAGEEQRIRLSKGRLQRINHGHSVFEEYEPMETYLPADTVRVALRKTKRGNILAAVLNTRNDKGIVCFFPDTKVRKRRLTREYLRERTTPVLSSNGQAALVEVKKAGYPKITVVQRL